MNEIKQTSRIFWYKYNTFYLLGGIAILILSSLNAYIQSVLLKMGSDEYLEMLKNSFSNRKYLNGFLAAFFSVHLLILIIYKLTFKDMFGLILIELLIANLLNLLF